MSARTCPPCRGQVAKAGKHRRHDCADPARCRCACTRDEIRRIVQSIDGASAGRGVTRRVGTSR